MSGDGGRSVVEGDETGPLYGLSLRGRIGGTMADPILQLIALILIVSAVFVAFPDLDLWFSGLFALHHVGFPLRGVAAFSGLAEVGALAVAAVALGLLAVIVWKLVHPERPTPLPANVIAFLLVGLIMVAWLTPVVLLAAAPERLPPTYVDLFGGRMPFVALWQAGGGCSTDCAAFSAATSWAVWLIGVAIIVPSRQRSAAIQALAALAVLLALNVVGRGEDYLSGILLSASTTALLMVIAYRFTIERPVPWLADGRLEQSLTRLGHALGGAWRDADWQAVALKAQSPWLDRRARLSPLKAATFALALLPGLWLLWLAVTRDLTPLPWVFLIYNSGIWALWFFLASLAVTPARHIFGRADLIAVRRMLGIAGLAYTLLHLADYAWLDRFSLGFIVNEYLTRPTIWVATLSTVGICILGATSFDEAIRQMGTRAWAQLHYVAYPAIGFAILHFDMSPGSFGGPPFLMTGMFFWLMAWRVLHRYGLATRPLMLLALGLVTPLVSFIFEVAWLAIYQGIRPEKTIAFTFETVDGLAPTWQLLILGLTVTMLATIFGRKSTSPARLTLRRNVAMVLPALPQPVALAEHAP